MTDIPTVSKFNLPTHTISVEELRRFLPKPKRYRFPKCAPITPPSLELMAELKGLLRQWHPDSYHPRHPWMSILMIIHHETSGHPDGFALADAWSRKGTKYKGTDYVRKYWNRIKPCPGNPLTIRTLRWLVDQKLG
jgi:hypothetical protein